jgi:hypothetical protein
MNSITTRSGVKIITSTIKFDSLTLVENGTVLKYKKNKVGEISYSELQKIYIKVYKLKPIYGFMLALFPMLFAFLCFEFIKINIEISLALMLVIPTIVKSNRFQRFGLVIVLKDGSVFKKHISNKFKSDAIELINEVKRKRLNYNNRALASA